jgi:4'-phosphopantetheinyl transferase
MLLSYTDITPIGNVRFDSLIRKIPKSLADKNAQFRHFEDRIRNLLGLLLLRRLYKITFGDYPELAQIEYTTLGRPYFPGLQSDFNISHSGDYVVCILSSSDRVGVDIEYKRQVSFMEFQRTMNESQWQEIHQAQDPFLIFFKYWCMKESVIKADGRGLSSPLAEIYFDQCKVHYDQCLWYLKPFELPKKHIGCVASNHEIQTIDMDLVTPEDLR